MSKSYVKLQNIVTLGRLKDARLKAGLSQAEVNIAYANATGDSLLNMGSIEDYERPLSIGKMFFLCDLYNVRPSYIVSGIGISSKTEYMQAVEKGRDMAIADMRSELDEMENDS